MKHLPYFLIGIIAYITVALLTYLIESKYAYEYVCKDDYCDLETFRENYPMNYVHFLWVLSLPLIIINYVEMFKNKKI